MVVRGSAQAILEWISTQRARMLGRVMEWANINSYSLNKTGVVKVGEAVEREFAGLGDVVERFEITPAEVIGSRGQIIQHALAPVIVITKRPAAPVKILLNIHLDTVYPPDSGFQSTVEEGENLRGPGVADAKGGLAVMLTALEALERSPNASRIGWRVILNSDEEIGSPGSGALLAEKAKDCQFGLLFEPALPDGAIVNGRRGSGNFSIIVRGRAAH